jgi:O-antigen/teichoic acid export membrane protein
MVKANIIANFFGQGWIALMGVAFIPIYIKYLGMESFGLIGIFVVVQAGLLLLDSGMTPTLVREFARFKGGKTTKEEVISLFRSIEFVTLALSLITVLVIYVLLKSTSVQWLKIDKISPDTVENSILIMSLIVIFRLYEGIYRGCLIGLQKQVILNYIGSIIATFRSLGAVAILAYIAPKIEYYFLWQCFMSILSVGVHRYSAYYFVSDPMIKPKFSIKELLKVKNFALGMFGTSVLSFFLTQTDKIILSNLLSLEKFAYYSFASIASSIIVHCIMPISQAFTPRFSEFFGSKNETNFKKDFHTASKLIAILGGSIFCTILFFGDKIIYLWTNDMELTKNTTRIVCILSAGNFLNILMWMPASAYNAQGFTRFSVIQNLFSIIFIIPALFIVIPLFGLEGAAFVWVGLNLGYHLFGSVFFFKNIKCLNIFDWYISDIIKPSLFIITYMLVVRLLFGTPDGRFAQIIFIVINLVLVILISLVIFKIISKAHYKVK